MKVKKLIKKMYSAIFSRDKKAEKELYVKSLKKSLQHKKTFAIK